MFQARYPKSALASFLHVDPDLYLVSVLCIRSQRLGSASNPEIYSSGVESRADINIAQISKLPPWDQ